MSLAPAALLWSPSTPADGHLPEGPRWLRVADRPTLAWVNMQSAPDATTGAIHLLDWATRTHRVLPQPGRPGFLLPTTTPNVVLVGQTKTIGLVDLRTNAWTPLVDLPDAAPRTLINDGEIVPGGQAIVFGTKDLRFADPIGHLYLFTLADRRLSVLADGQTCSNGKVFVGTTLYDIDSPTKCVRRYELDVAQRILTPAGLALDLRERPDFPDGMVGTGAGLLIAFYHPDAVATGAAVHFPFAGVPQTIAVPGSPRVTCPLLALTPAGPRLFLTTAREGMVAAVQQVAPHAGSVFMADWPSAVPDAECVLWPS
jgi:sugar lactone lactonase YvrE